MPLPNVKGWLIDFRTAKAIFVTQSNARITHCVSRCHDGTLHICHTEAERFSNDPALAAPFMIDQCRIFEPDEDVFHRCQAIGANGCGKPILASNETGVFLSAIAMAHNFGVISDHRSPKFATVFDMCAVLGVPVLSAEEYFGLV
ncbi:hypothetical protein MBUL_03900 [Methylobacterium bullatum]|uniref:Uncharacterized protein n=1 Tax=Methylobacterium bullatum TaxID=570505 RepID=A0A679JDV1_9HYPH|nr:hypothetical protein MBUL_03900 [Methylobacterium bullatum]